MKFLKFEKYTYLEEKHQKYLEELANYVQNSKYLPKFHIYPQSGLMNDPNGLAYFNGEYQIFYQWFPFEASHGMKHWARVVSKDLTDWEWKGTALIPNKEYEKNGCYSGNAIEKDGKLYLFYTANYKIENGRIPKQAVAFMDKKGNIEKYEKNPIISGAPEGFTGDIRDPFVFEKNGQYYMLLGGRTENEEGKLLLYKSSDLLKWDYEGILEIGINNIGFMYECPSYIQVDGKDVLIFSPMGLAPNGDRYHNQFTSLYMIGNLDLEKKRFTVEFMDELDCGFDFYAPQVFYGKDKKPLMIGWFGCGEQVLPTDKEMWRHGLTMARELHIVDGKLYTNPVKEMDKVYKHLEISKCLNCVPAEKYYITETEILKNTEKNEPVILQFGTDNDNWKLIVDFKRNRITLDRNGLAQKFDEKYGLERSCSIKKTDKVKLKIYVDNSFVEICINDGERMMSSRVFFL